MKHIYPLLTSSDGLNDAQDQILLHDKCIVKRNEET